LTSTLFLLALASCVRSSTGSPSATSGDGNACIPGQSVACVGVGGCPGGQVCNSDARGFGPCQCGEPAGGTAGVGSTGGSTGTSSSGSTGAASSGSGGGSSGGSTGGLVDAGFDAGPNPGCQDAGTIVGFGEQLFCCSGFATDAGAPLQMCCEPPGTHLDGLSFEALCCSGFATDEDGGNVFCCGQLGDPGPCCVWPFPSKFAPLGLSDAGICVDSPPCLSSGIPDSGYACVGCCAGCYPDTHAPPYECAGVSCIPEGAFSGETWNGNRTGAICCPGLVGPADQTSILCHRPSTSTECQSLSDAGDVWCGVDSGACCLPGETCSNGTCG
jgi:hypothetical protein